MSAHKWPPFGALVPLVAVLFISSGTLIISELPQTCVISGLDVFTEEDSSSGGFVMTLEYNVALLPGAPHNIDTVVLANGELLGYQSGKGRHKLAAFGLPRGFYHLVVVCLPSGADPPEHDSESSTVCSSK